MLLCALGYVLALVTSGCGRKAPGPEECRLFAYHVSGVASSELLRVPELRRRVDDITQTCLTTPFDREFLRCVEAKGSSSACTVQFERRRAASR